TGFIRPVYFTILISHTVLAVVNLPFVVITVVRGLTGDFARHKKIAMRVWAVWLYVAITGPVVYLILYQLYPPSHAFEEGQKLHRAGDEPGALAKYEIAAKEGDPAAICYAAVLSDRLHGPATATRTLAS